LVRRKKDGRLVNLLCVVNVQGGAMSLMERMALLAAAAFGTVVIIPIARWKRTFGLIEAAWNWWPPARRARRLAEEAAYEQWKRECGGAWLDSWWNTPEAARPLTRKRTAARPEVPGRVSVEEARRKLDALLELTVARGATPAEAAAAQAIAARLKSEYDLS
jgi:hypothetical protein